MLGGAAFDFGGTWLSYLVGVVRRGVLIIAVLFAPEAEFFASPHQEGAARARPVPSPRRLATAFGLWGLADAARHSGCHSARRSDPLSAPKIDPVETTDLSAISITCQTRNGVKLGSRS
jgi:hypothetical protein